MLINVSLLCRVSSVYFEGDKDYSHIRIGVLLTCNLSSHTKRGRLQILGLREIDLKSLPLSS